MSVAICIASGPSLTKEDVEYCRGKGRVIVINNCYKLAPWAHTLYACDGRWWAEYHEDVKKKFKGELWTIDFAAADKYGLNCIGVLNTAIFSNNPDAIATGHNSGFQAFNLAAIQGASKIILLGYDMKPRGDGVRHWHGNHKKSLVQTNPAEYPKWVERFRQASKLIKIPVINCTRDSAIDCFEKAKLRDVL